MYEVTVFASKYMQVGDDGYQTVEIPMDFKMSDWDDVQNLIGYMVEGKRRVKFEIKKVEDEA